MSTPHKYLVLLGELQALVEDWERQDQELASALAGLEECDRDSSAESASFEKACIHREIIARRKVLQAVADAEHLIFENGKLI